jgi:hypothetical protein
MTSKPARRAPGRPGIEPRWTHGAKVAVGTALWGYAAEFDRPH